MTVSYKGQPKDSEKHRYLHDKVHGGSKPGVSLVRKGKNLPLRTRDTDLAHRIRRDPPSAYSLNTMRIPVSRFLSVMAGSSSPPSRTVALATAVSRCFQLKQARLTSL